ncbi:hypothetical protein FZEAL_1818 [Fusarium zealandicum]|uniref:Ankyrin repeat protein n=1 Tax=Fusarium zealandicum TaxID=1053134 RepID=A0A8H4XND8_9HYPO|nr:hypothetical protein FZEAL_1818 [Fusarium zealandicum]
MVDSKDTEDFIRQIESRTAEIEELVEAVTRTTGQLQELLTLKQQQAGIIEAKAALIRADESIRQGRAIMAFTIVTILFLPLGFFAAFFGMNNSDYTGDEWMKLGHQVMYMFLLSAAVITITLSMAFIPGTSLKRGKGRVLSFILVKRFRKGEESKGEKVWGSGRDVGRKIQVANMTNAEEIGTSKAPRWDGWWSQIRNRTSTKLKDPEN